MDLEAENGVEAMEEWCLLASPASFFLQLRTTCPGVAIPTEGGLSLNNH